MRSVRAEDARAQFSCSVLDSLTSERRRSAPAHIDIAREYTNKIFTKYDMMMSQKMFKPRDGKFYSPRSLKPFACEQFALNTWGVSSSSNRLKAVSDIITFLCLGQRITHTGRLEEAESDYVGVAVGGQVNPLNSSG